MVNDFVLERGDIHGNLISSPWESAMLLRKPPCGPFIKRTCQKEEAIASLHAQWANEVSKWQITIR